MNGPVSRRAAAIALLVLVAVGVALVYLLTGGGSSGTPGPTSTAEASAPSPSASPTPPAEPASAPPSPGPTASSSTAPTPAPTTPAPSAAGPAPATLAFTALRLDAREDPDGRDRVITFHADGPGQVTAVLRTLSPQGTTRMCLASGTQSFGCQTTAAGELTATASDAVRDFTLTLRGTAIETPSVEITITFPATDPAVTITDARFDGTAFPDTNGLQAIIAPRADGEVRLVADWGGHPFLYEIHLADLGGSGGTDLVEQGPAPRVDLRLPVSAPGPWRLLVQNSETGFGVTPMTATIRWP